MNMTGQIDMFDGKMTQEKRILRHMKDFGTITSREAMFDYGIMRLASRISDLRRKGYSINSKMVTAKNRYNEDTYFSEYSLVQ